MPSPRLTVWYNTRCPVCDAGIDRHVRSWEKPSDHVPVWIDLDIEAK